MILKKSWKFLVIFSFLLWNCRSSEEIECRRCNVVIVSVDTLAAKHMSQYGYFRDTSSVIDFFVKKSVIFERAFAPSPFTAPSHASLFTGVYPEIHGVRNITRYFRKQTVINGNLPTIAEILKDAGYTTVGFHGGGNVSGIFGFNRGFDFYLNKGQPSKRYDRWGYVKEALAWLNDAKEPFFLFFHTYGPHDPYLLPEDGLDIFWKDKNNFVVSWKEFRKLNSSIISFPEIRDRFWNQFNLSNELDVRRLISLYDALVRYTLEKIAPLLKEVIDKFPKTVVVFTSDHGEEFGEHGNFLHSQLYNETLHVPLFIYIPKVGTKKIPTNVSLIDVTPTLLDILGIDKKEIVFQGISLIPTIVSFSDSDRFILAESRSVSNYSASLIVGNWKFIGGLEKELYDLRNDFDENRNLCEVLSSKCNEMFENLNKQTAINNNFKKRVVNSNVLSR